MTGLVDRRDVDTAIPQFEFEDVVQSLRDDMALVEARVRLAAQVEYPGLGRLLQAIVESGGKRLRPLLLLLAARPFDYRIEPLIPAAAGIELLHTASLVHDDTIDTSQLRRGQPTLNSVFDTGTVILIGDYLFAQSAILAAETMNPRVVAVFASSLADICDGQLREAFTAHRLDQSPEEYSHRIYGKTASLFAGAAEMGAILGGANADETSALRGFGGDIGMAFQIIDDVLDYDGDTQEMGKNLGDDLREGKATLPLIAAMQRGSATQAQMVRHAIENGSTDQLDAIVTVVRETGALDVAREAAAAEAHRAIEAISTLPDSAYRTALLQLAAQLLQRRT